MKNCQKNEGSAHISYQSFSDRPTTDASKISVGSLDFTHRYPCYGLMHIRSVSLTKSVLLCEKCHTRIELPSIAIDPSAIHVLPKLRTALDLIQYLRKEVEKEKLKK
ncbi:hypothetical protein ACFL3E_02300 [Patescibacteria group bacterium]